MSNVKEVASEVSFSNRSCAEFFANTKGSGTSFQVAVFVVFLIISNMIIFLIIFNNF